MSSKQLRFYIHPNDYAEINKYLAEQNIYISALPLITKELRIVDDLQQGKEDWLGVVLFKNKNDVIINTTASKINLGENVYYVDTMCSHIVEFDRCYYNEDKKQLKSGRAYFITKFYSNNNLTEKALQFTEWSSMLFLFLKKILHKIKEGEHKNYYVSKTVISLLSNNQIELIE